MTERNLLICAALSVLLHWVIARALEELPARKPVPPRRVQITVVDAPKPPEPAKAPEPPPEPEPPPQAKPQTQPKPQPQKPQPAKTQVTATVPETTPSTSTTAVSVETTGDDEPVFSATMTSSSGGGTGSASTGTSAGKPTGSGTGGAANGNGTAPIAAYEATKMPMPRGQCFGKYTDAAKAAGVEGTVVLDLTVSEDGAPREIRVTQGLSHGLDEAAIAAVRACSFTPGEKEGKRVPVRVRGFKITFVLQEAL